MKHLKIDVITNSGFVNLETEFEELFMNANSVDIATAFITSSSIKLIKGFLKAEDRQLKLIVGLYGGFNSKKDLQELQKLATRKGSNFYCKISRDPLFHWKYYSFNEHKRITKYVGSANFTSRGIKNAGELTLKLVGESKTREVRILNSEFKKLWEKESIDIREVPLSKYRSKERKQIDSPGFIIGKEIKALLNFVKTKQAIRHVKPEKGACYLDVISSYMTKETEKTIYQKRSNWEKQKYTFMCSSKKTDFTRWKNSKYILQYEIIGKRKRIGLFEIMDHTEFSTKDGKYFVALKRMSNTGVKQLDAVSTKNFLKSIRLKSTKDQKAKKLTRAQTEEIFDYFIKHK